LDLLNNLALGNRTTGFLAWELAARKDGSLPVDAILMQLGRACLTAGKAQEAKQAFTRIVDEFPESTYLPDARRELDNLAAKASA
jgi:TolA-binding protein